VSNGVPIKYITIPTKTKQQIDILPNLPVITSLYILYNNKQILKTSGYAFSKCVKAQLNRYVYVERILFNIRAIRITFLFIKGNLLHKYIIIFF
jgi:hypothetical protein